MTPPSPFRSPRRTALGWARSFWFCFGVFFVLYHLCYENIIHKTDGMEYLSDWTFVLLGVVFGLLGAHSLLAPGAVAPSLTETAVVLHGICWSTNILSTAGAWYSFFFFPQCESLEGVDNYPACYLEWYRLTEHGLNMLILLGDYAVGLVPVRRKDYGHSLVFLAVYIVWTWYVWSRDGKCPYVMFVFNAGWSSVPWFNFSFVGVTAAFFLTEKMYARRDANRLANGETNGLGASGGLPSHVTYEAANADEYEYK